MRSSAFADFLDELRAALAYPFETWRRIAGLAFVAAVTYVVLIFSTMPEFTIQMLGAGLHWFDYVLISLTETAYQTDGFTTLGVIVLYAVLTGVAVVNAAAQLRVVGLSSLTDLTGVLPGLLASGCASCGAGLLGFLGFAGGLAALPFEGHLVRVAGLALLVFFLGRTGNPEQCRIETDVSR
ncbi:hypothetical protein ACFOZ7_19155 [Natribaculum luteum]|uniref:Uncharacterized protein n=1 Tax=Natribaculum luteum TaxID=1586232 RepID=A0ABD5P516_9EURY|nr:hypothetical protein [Natribaculum luteum]